MNLEDYRTVFIAGSLVLILIAASPVLGLVVSFPSGNEKFSELWLLGPNHLAEDYPFNVHVNESYSVFVGVGNHLGISSYYLIYAKFRNQTQLLPNDTSSMPSPLAPVYEFRAFVKSEGIWESPLVFRFSNISFYGGKLVINSTVINDEAFNVSSFSNWDSEHHGFYFQMFFELWLYNVSSQTFQFNDRFVGIWLNVTG